MMIDRTRTIEDEIADKDEDWMKARKSSAAWAIENQGKDVPEDIHERRFQSVIEGEKRDLAERGER